MQWQCERVMQGWSPLPQLAFETTFLGACKDVSSFCLFGEEEWYPTWIHLTANSPGSLKLPEGDLTHFKWLVLRRPNSPCLLGCLAQVWTLQRCSADGGGEFPCTVYGWERSIGWWRLFDAIGWEVSKWNKESNCWHPSMLVVSGTGRKMFVSTYISGPCDFDQFGFHASDLVLKLWKDVPNQRRGMM